MLWGIIIVLFGIAYWQWLYIRVLHKKEATQSRLIRALSLNNEMLVQMNHNLKNVIYGGASNYKRPDPDNGGEGE